MKTLVIGLGISGRSAANLLLHQGFQVTGIDGNRDLLASNADVAAMRSKGLVTQHESELSNIEQFASVVVSPGIHPQHPVYATAKEMGIPILGEVELACRYIKGTFLGVTGTNGKTTVTLLTAHVLQHAGKRVKALGNVGVPLSAQCLDDSSDIAVVELSSFQLDTLQNQVIDAAVLLNVTPDHLDRYGNMDEYARSKLHIADCLKPNGCLFIENKCHQEFGHLRPDIQPKTYGYQSDCNIMSDLKHLITGKKIACVLPSQFQARASHDLENLMAAYALCSCVGITPEQFLEGLATFKKPHHRIEYVRTVNGVAYYDDSKGTNLDAVIRAVESLSGPIVLVAGGVDKGAAYTPWIQAFADKVKCICAIGQAAPKIKKDLDPAIPVELFENLEQAVLGASKRAFPGETILLSPGCSSFDMFRDYVHRGEEFQRIIHNL